MPKLSDAGIRGFYAKFSKQGVVIEIIHFRRAISCQARQKPLMIQRLKDFPTFGKVAQAIQPHCIEALEDIKRIVIARGMAVLIKEALNLLKTGNDPFFAGRPAGRCLSRSGALSHWRAS